MRVSSAPSSLIIYGAALTFSSQPKAEKWFGQRYAETENKEITTNSAFETNLNRKDVAATAKMQKSPLVKTFEIYHRKYD